MLIVKKFGGTSVANRERILHVAKRCKKEYEKGNDVVVVLSAMGDVTDQLIDKAKEINETPSEREMDMLFTIGEQMSVALMAMALEGLGVPAVSLNAFQAKIHTTSVHGDAKITHIETERIREELAQKKIVIVTGFQGIDENDDYTTLLIQRQLLWRQPCRQMPVKFIQMSMVCIPLIPERYRQQKSWTKSPMMICCTWR